MIAMYAMSLGTRLQSRGVYITYSLSGKRTGAISYVWERSRRGTSMISSAQMQPKFLRVLDPLICSACTQLHAFGFPSLYRVPSKHCLVFIPLPPNVMRLTETRIAAYHLKYMPTAEPDKGFVCSITHHSVTQSSVLSTNSGNGTQSHNRQRPAYFPIISVKATHGPFKTPVPSFRVFKRYTDCVS